MDEDDHKYLHTLRRYSYFHKLNICKRFLHILHPSKDNKQIIPVSITHFFKLNFNEFCLFIFYVRGTAIELIFLFQTYTELILHLNLIS